MPVALKKHSNTFGLVSPVRTFYLQAETPNAVQEWLKVIEEARQALIATSTQNTVTTPISIPTPRSRSGERSTVPVTPSPPFQAYHTATTSESEDEYPVSSLSNRETLQSSQSNPSGREDPSKVILSGYLMKCGSKRRNWRKRWFVLTGEKLVYSGSHMVRRVIDHNCPMDLISLLIHRIPNHTVKSRFPR
jgi:hypothetical protein